MEGSYSSDHRTGSLGSERRGVFVAIATIGIVCLFLFPIPRQFLDVLLAINLTLSLVLLIRGLLLSDPTHLFAFPTLLLLTTLFRLGLNISSTRLILLDGQRGLDAAGNVIKAFGEFVVQGDFLVGAILFSVIALVNFIVITRGSARVAEVSARFSLDSLPGKQLAIDSDLRAGSITREEAERRRGVLTRESGFYGAMDGAMKFIQGDAIACLAIVVINVIGGTILGITEPRNMTVEDALRRYGVLAIGDGLVSILPALLISVCSGIVVTTVSRGGQMTVSSQVFQTIMSDRLAILLGGFAAILFSLLPGFPFWPFLGVGLIALIAALRPNLLDNVLSRFKWKLPRATELLITSAPPKMLGTTGYSYNLLTDRREESDFSSVVLELSRGTVAALGDVGEIEEAYLVEKMRFYESRGVSLLPLSIRMTESQLDERVRIASYRISLSGRVCQEGSSLLRQIFVRSNPTKLLALGCEIRALGRDPLTGAPGTWIESDEKVEAALDELSVSWITPVEFIATQCVSCQAKNINELFGVDETKQIMSQLAERAPRLVEEFSSGNFLNSHELCSVFRSLIQDRVGVRNSKLILDGILEFASVETLPEAGSNRSEWLKDCTKALRRKLRSLIVDTIADDAVRVFVLHTDLNDEFKEAADGWNDSAGPLPLEPGRAGSIRKGIQRLFQPVLDRGQLPALILCDSEVRDAVDHFLESQKFTLPGGGEEVVGNEWYRTLSFEEIGGRYRVETVGVIRGS